MDSRVGSLIGGLASSPTLNPATARDRIWRLVNETPDESSKEALMHAYDVIMGIAIGHLERMGKDVQALKDVVSADRQGFALVEAMADGGSIEPRALCHIVDREAAAGRMTRSEVLLTLNAAAGQASGNHRWSIH